MWYIVDMKDINKMIAKYIKTNRIRLKKTQKDLAEEAGISLMTLRRAEGGEIVSLETIVALMEVFGELESLTSLFTVSEVTPRAMIDQQEKNRKRVRKSKKEEDKGWVWGDSAE